jgi:hypothetical protein
MDHDSATRRQFSGDDGWERVGGAATEDETTQGGGRHNWMPPLSPLASF